MKPKHEKTLEVAKRCLEYPETELSRLEIKNLLLCYRDAIESRYETWEIAEAWDTDSPMGTLRRLGQNREKEMGT